MEEYTAYPISSGAFSFASSNAIKNDMITADNTLDLVKVAAGKRDKNIKPVVKVPLRIALYIIQDREGKASFTVPVTGNVQSPEFSYSKIVTRTLVNLLVKVAATPFDFIGQELGLKSEMPKSIPFTMAQKQLSTVQQVVLGDLAKMLEAKQELQLTLKSAYESAKAEQSAAMLMAKSTYIAHQNGMRQATFNAKELIAATAVTSNDAAFI